MGTNITLLITLLAYSMVVSQSFMYILAFKNVQFSLPAGPYTQMRKLIDSNMRASFTYVIYAALLANLVLVLLTIQHPGSLLFITATVALVALVIDVWLTLKGSLPINDVINAWPVDGVPSDWAVYREKWFSVFQYRQVANIIGFLSLLAGTVFGAR